MSNRTRAPSINRCILYRSFRGTRLRDGIERIDGGYLQNASSCVF